MRCPRLDHGSKWQHAIPLRSHCPLRSCNKPYAAVKPGPHVATDVCLQHLSATVAATGVLLLLHASPCLAEDISIAFPASADPQIRTAQKTLVEAWAYVDNLYVDTLPHKQWSSQLQDRLAASFKAADVDDVTAITRSMLAELDDPYTRLLMPEENSALEAEEQGKVVSTGLGLQQLQVPSAAGAAGCGAGPSEQQTEPQPLLVVSFVVEGSPAAAAGIKAGDAVLDIKGQPVAGKELRDVYKLLSQEADVTLVRQPGLTGQQGSTRSSAAADADGSGSSSVPRPQCMTDAAAAAAAGCGADGGLLQDAEVYSVHLEPAPLDFEPVQYGIVDLSQQLPSADTPVDGSSSSQASGHVGYLKIVTFSATSPQAAAEALQDMQQEAAGLPGGLSGLIVDLRDNPGGIVEAGVDIAQDFLHAGQVLCIVVDKTGQEERVVLPEAHTLTEVPLAVLVNHSTASTSELLAGTLRDELHAPLIGTTTYGKGRTQRVIPLSDGKSTLLVSTLKYFTPQHTTIDKEGLVPDVVCSPDAVLGQQWVGGDVGQGAGSLLDDPCIKLAAERLTQVEVS